LQAVPNTSSLWQRLRSSRAALASLYVIGIACLLAIFAYPFAPDGSPNATRIITELKDKPPGFSALFLKVPSQPVPAKKSAVERLFAGSPPQYRLLPLSAFFFARDTIVVEHYISQRQRETMAFPINDLLPRGKERLDLGRQQRYIYHHNIDRSTFILGTDSQGRDVLSRLLIATRTSLLAGLVAVLLSLSIGTLLGILAGYYRGLLSAVVTYLVDVLSAIPLPLLVFALTLSIGRGFWQICIAVGLAMWVSTARLIRRQIIRLKELDYVQAAHLLGLSRIRVLFHHILPNMGGALLTTAISSFAAAILIEGGLSFLGIGIQPPIPSWGAMAREGFSAMGANRVVMTLVPGLAITILALAFHTLSHAIRNIGGEQLEP
jgi:peptide/nickel transport system permease protein